MADAARLVDPIPGAVVAGAACRAAQRRNRVADARPRTRRYQGRGRGGRDAGRSAAGVDGLKMRATLSIEAAAAALLLIDLQEEQRRSEARRVGKECVSTCRLRGSPEP